MEDRKKIDIHKYLYFPYGIITSTLAWLPIYFGLIQVFWAAADAWARLIVFAVGELCMVLLILWSSFFYAKGGLGKCSIYIFLTPEDGKDDKYISCDFANEFRAYASKGIPNLNVIVPNLIKRDSLDRVVTQKRKRGIDFWETKEWKRLHKRLRGDLYISGTLQRRNTNGEPHYIFRIAATIGYSNFNECLNDNFVEAIKKQVPQNYKINCNFEVEEFENFSKKFASTAEYLIGWARLISGDVTTAYKLHSDIVRNSRVALGEMHGGIDDALKYEVAALNNSHSGNRFLSYFIDYHELFPNDSTGTMLVAKHLIISSMCTEELIANAKQAHELMMKIRIDKTNRNAVYANIGYISLILKRYEAAETSYVQAFKKLPSKVATEIIDYCDEVITSQTRTHEKSIAFYVKALMLHKGVKRKEEARHAYIAAIQYIEYCRDKENYLLEKSRLAVEELS